MRKKSHPLWKRAGEGTLAELVGEGRALRKKDILFVIRQLCLLPAEQDNFLHPKNILVERDGIWLLKTPLPFPEREAYLPPERGRTEAGECGASGERVYALGMLMLYMGTGTLKKAEAEAVLGDRSLLSLIRRCTAFAPEERFRDDKALLEAIEGQTDIRKRILPALSAALFAFLLAAILLFSCREGRARGRAVGEAAGYDAGFPAGFEQGLSDAPGIGLREAALGAHSGNLSGNYAAEGGAVAVSGGGRVFFVLDGSVRQMDPYTGETRTLLPAAGAYDLQFYGDRLYCCTEKKLLSIDPETAKAEELCDSRGDRFYIFDDGLYLYDSAGTSYLYRVNPDTGGVTQLNGAVECRCLNVVEGKLYYIAPDLGSCICRSDLDGNNVSLISSSAYGSLCIHGGHIYAGSKDGLIRMDLNGGAIESLAALPADAPIATDGGIFYISGSDRTLNWLSSDGKTRYTIVSTRTGGFNVAGQWIFYQNQEDGGRLWRVRIGGADNARLTQ